MSSGGFGQPSPSNNKKYGKKHYVVKLLSRLNNQNSSSCQPNTLIPSSTHGYTPLVANATQSTLPVADATASTPSPCVGYNASTPNLDIALSLIQILEGCIQFLQPIT